MVTLFNELLRAGYSELQATTYIADLELPLAARTDLRFTKEIGNLRFEGHSELEIVDIMRRRGGGKEWMVLVEEFAAKTQVQEVFLAEQASYQRHLAQRAQVEENAEYKTYRRNLRQRMQADEEVRRAYCADLRQADAKQRATY